MAGHDNFHLGNLYAYVGWCYMDLGGGEVTNTSHRDHHEHNTCIQRADTPEYAAIRCKLMPDNRTEDTTQVSARVALEQYRGSAALGQC